MKRVKTITALLLCVLLLLPTLAACNKQGEDGGNTTYGRYVEEDITPEGFTGETQRLVTFEDGTLDLISLQRGPDGSLAGGAYLRWRSTDGGTGWQPVDMSWAAQYMQDYSQYHEQGAAPPEEVWLTGLLPFQNGDLLAQVLAVKNDEANGTSTQANTFYRVAMDGTQTPYHFAAYEAAAAGGKNVNVYNLQPLPGGRMYANFEVEVAPSPETEDPNYDWSQNQTTAVFDMESGEKLYDIAPDAWDFFSSGDTLYTIKAEGVIEAFNLADGTPSTRGLPGQEVLALVANNYGRSTLVDGDGNFYLTSTRGMEKAAPGATETEQVMDGINYSYGSPLYGVGSMVYNSADGSILMALSDYNNMTSGVGKVLRYQWDDKAVATSDKRVKVFSLYDNATVRLALSQFKREHPDVTLEYDTAFPPAEEMLYTEGEQTPADTGKNEEDALRALNTELLAGNGPDVLILDGLPVESFIDKGILADLSDAVNKGGEVYPTVMDPMRRDGKLYAAPINFYVPTLIGEQGYVEQFAALDTLVTAAQGGADAPIFREMDPNWGEAEQNAYYQELYGPKNPEQQPVLYFETLDEAYTALYNTCAPAMMSEKGGIDAEKLGQFLRAVKALSDKYALATGDSAAAYGGGKGAPAAGYGGADYSPSLVHFAQRQGRLGSIRFGSFSSLRDLSNTIFYSATGKGVADTTSLPPLIPGAVVAPGLAAGVYIPSQLLGVTATAKDPAMAHEFVATCFGEEVQKYDMGNGFPVLRSAMQYQYQNYLDGPKEDPGMTLVALDYEALVGALQSPLYPNNYLREVIYKPVQKYCEGALSEADAVAQIVSETELYFAERK